MRRALAWIALAALTGAAEPPARLPSFSGRAALEFTRQAVSFGPRPSGSAAARRLRAYIRAELALCRCQVEEDAFTAETPSGPVPMTNLIARFGGVSGRMVVITGHYDTKSMPGGRFVGANDGGSSTGFLLELAQALARLPHRNQIVLVWFDGEEAFRQWSETDGTYGSRHLARKWAADGTLGRIRALINVDMIGDQDLGILDDHHSSATLRRLIWTSAAELGLGRYFLNAPGAILDDHMPFVSAGVNAVDLIDFNYGPDNSYWHTSRDTMDKLSADSFRVVGTVVLEAIQRLE
jgi:glutaminyl-peptide cyclotransferase